MWLSSVCKTPCIQVKSSEIGSTTVMPKHGTTSTTTDSAGAATTKKRTGRTTSNDAKFPGLSMKKGLECRVLLEDQILLIDVRTVDVTHNRLS